MGTYDCVDEVDSGISDVKLSLVVVSSTEEVVSVESGNRGERMGERIGSRMSPKIPPSPLDMTKSSRREVEKRGWV